MSDEPVKILDKLKQKPKPVEKKEVKIKYAKPEESVKLKAEINQIELQKGDVHKTHADIAKISLTTKYIPKTEIRKGIVKFLKWYNEYFQDETK